MEKHASVDGHLPNGLDAMGPENEVEQTGDDDSLLRREPDPNLKRKCLTISPLTACPTRRPMGDILRLCDLGTSG